MASVSYSEVYSKFFSKISAYDFLSLTEDQINDSLCNWLHSAAMPTYMQKLFDDFSFDDEIQTISYIIKYTVRTEFDAEFVADILSDGMIMEWLMPKINNVLSIAQMFGSKEEKYYSQAAHLKEIRELYDNIRHRLMQKIADRGYSWNTYLDGA